MTGFAHLTSLLFVPMLKERYLLKALGGPARAVILDLEDAVPPADKGRARDALTDAVALLRGAGKIVFVRCNADDEADWRQCRRVMPDGVFLPKADDAAAVRAAAAGLAGDAAPPPLVPMIEGARGLLAAEEIAAEPGVVALMFGAGDFVADTGFAMAWDALSGPAATMAIAAIAHGRLAWGLAGSIAILNDAVALGRLAERSRSIGYAATPVIHPDQIDPVDRAFSPSADELTQAERVVEAFAGGAGGASRLGDVFIERPAFLRAQALLRRRPVPFATDPTRNTP